MNAHGQWVRRPAGRDARGRVLLVHGFGEHSGRHAALADDLAAAGFEVHAGDLRGHGVAPGRRGHIRQWGDFLADVDAGWDALPDDDLPRALYGHSLGGLIALDWALSRRPQVRGVALASPPFRMGFEPPGWRKRLARLVSRLWPTLTQPSGIPAEAISSVPAEVEAYRADPHGHGVASARFFVEYELASRRLARAGPELPWPVHLLVGEDESISSLPAIREFAASNPARIELHTYPGGRHELFHEAPKIRAAALRDLVAFLERVTAGAASGR